MSDELREHEEVEASLSSQQTAVDAAMRQYADIKRNPEFVEVLREVGIDSDKYDWVEDELGALTAGVHLLANRQENYRDYARLLNRNRVERKIAQHSPGRLCKGTTRKIAQRVHGRPDKSEREPFLADDRQQLRLAASAATAFQTLGVNAEGLSAVADVTTVSQVERSGESSRVEKASGFLSR